MRRWKEDQHTLIQAHTLALICCEMLVKLFNLADVGLLVEGLCSSQHHRVQLVSAWQGSDGWLSPALQLVEAKRIPHLLFPQQDGPIFFFKIFFFYVDHFLI